VSESTLIRDATIVTNDRNRRIIQGGSLVVEKDKIGAIGKTDDVKKAYGNTSQEIDAKGKIVIPGLVQVHTHVMGHLFKGFTEDGAEDAFYRTCLPMEDFITAKDAYWLSLAGSTETLKFGTVMINDIFHYSSETAKAIRDIGMRAIIEHKVFDVESLSNIQHMNYSRDYEAGKSRLKANEKLITEWHGAANGRIHCWIGNHAPDTNSPELLKAGRKLADQYKVGIHTHVAQSKREVQYVKQQYGKTSVQFLDSIGFLKPDVVCAHLAFATVDDIKILERTGANMAHCPVIMGKFGSFPLIKDFLNSEVKIGLGCDWVTLNPWDEMRSAIEITRAITQDISLQNAQRAFEMITLQSSRILQVDDHLGSLETGKKADLVIIDPKKPNLAPMKEVLQSLVYNMTGNEVETVMIDGNIVVEKGRTTMVDEETTVQRAQEIAESIWSQAGVWPLQEGS
jgi:5-methylthioadenosine/S-adenosylhomocysteine deaminase